MALAAEYDVVLLPTFAQVESYRKLLANQSDAGLFSCAVSTFAAWIADLWELHGDGRRLVDGVQRRTIMQAACTQVYSDDNLAPGLSQLAARCERQAAGLAAFEQALDQAECCEGPQGLHAGEQLFLAAIARYRALLDEHDLIELGQACATLAQHADEVLPRSVRVLMKSASPLDWMQHQFFDECPQVQLTFELAPGGEGVERMPEHLNMRFAFPAGRYAQPALVADLVREQGGEGPVVVACADPLCMYKKLERALARDGVEVCVQARVRFGQTDFGRTIVSLLDCAYGDVFDPAALSDVVQSPFSGFARHEAVGIDKELRADSLAERDEWLRRLCSQSDEFSRLDDVVRDPDASILLGAVEQRVMAFSGRSQAWRSEQLAAIGALRSVMEAARLVHLPMKECADVLDNLSVTVSYAGVLAEAESLDPQVIVTTQAVASTMAPKSCALAIICDLTSEDSSVSERDDAGETLLVKLGFSRTDTALARSRRMFYALEHLPSQGIVLMRSLNDVDAKPLYPAVVLEELVDVYRDDPTSTDDIANLFRLPKALQEGMVQRGEELLFANSQAVSVSADQPLATSIAEPPLDVVNVGNAAKVLLPRRTSTGKVLERSCPSPSQIERYLECPYRWFVESRLKPKQLDEQFGPLEKGIFAHEALETFYRRFQQAGYPKVNDANLAEAQELMREVLDELVRDQVARTPGNNRLVPRTQLEARELSALCDNIVNYLPYEAQILPTFHPAYLEFTIPPDKPVDYAGYQLVGKVDRIDVDDAGRAVIVDYKGSLDYEYDILGKTPNHVGKVQTRIYAQAVKRVLGLNVVGAVYVSYGRTHTMHGSVDQCLESGHLPEMNYKRCRCGLKTIEDAAGVDLTELVYSDYTFSAVLDLTEQRVAEAIAAMKRGSVPAAPAYQAVCKYCTIPRCTKGGA